MSKRRAGKKGLVKIFLAVGNKVFSVGESVQKIRGSMRQSTSVAKKQIKSSSVFRVEEPVSDFEENSNSQLWGGATSLDSFDKESEKFSLAKFFKRVSTDSFQLSTETPSKRRAVKTIVSGFLMAAFTSVLLFYFVVPFLFLGIGGALSFLFTVYFVRTYPKRKLNSRVAEVNRVLPYALRHMSTQLSSGIGLPETITSISRADYGALSEEFGR
ncbi:MAG: hypothetical protein QW315_05725, partial [Candidatus Hadarchaeum sp.]